MTPDPLDLDELRRGLERALKHAELRIIMSGTRAPSRRALAEAQAEFLDAAENLAAYRRAVGSPGQMLAGPPRTTHLERESPPH